MRSTKLESVSRSGRQSEHKQLEREDWGFYESLLYFTKDWDFLFLKARIIIGSLKEVILHSFQIVSFCYYKIWHPCCCIKWYFMVLYKIRNYRNLLIEFHYPYISPVNKSTNIPPVLKMYIVNDFNFKIIMEPCKMFCAL